MKTRSAFDKTNVSPPKHGSLKLSPQSHIAARVSTLLGPPAKCQDNETNLLTLFQLNLLLLHRYSRTDNSRIKHDNSQHESVMRRDMLAAHHTP